MQRLKRGDKHPTENLIFYQYHPELKNGEKWVTVEEYERQKKLHALSSLKARWSNPIRNLISNVTHRDRKVFNSPIDELVTSEWVIEKLKEQDGRCYWFNVPLELTFSENYKIRLPLKLSLDRLDNTKGYTKENCVICCYAANCGRGNASVENWTKCVQIIKEYINN